MTRGDSEMRVHAGRSNTLDRVRAGNKSADLPATTRAPDLLDVLDMLREGGVTFDLDHSARSPRLAWSKAPTAEGLAWLAPHTAMLTNVALGRYTGHAPARCTVCGELAMISITNAGGSTRRGRKSAPFPKCYMTPKCAGVLTIRETDFEGVARRRRRKGTR